MTLVKRIIGVLGDDCGPHCGIQYGLERHCPCEEMCHGRNKNGEN